MFTKSELFSTNQNRELVYSFMSAKFIGLLCRLQLGGDVQACLKVVMCIAHCLLSARVRPQHEQTNNAEN